MKPNKLDVFMYALMKAARRNSLMDFIEEWGISEEEYDEIALWFKCNFDIKL